MAPKDPTFSTEIVNSTVVDKHLILFDSGFLADKVDIRVSPVDQSISSSITAKGRHLASTILYNSMPLFKEEVDPFVAASLTTEQLEELKAKLSLEQHERALNYWSGVRQEISLNKNLKPEEASRAKTICSSIIGKINYKLQRKNILGFLEENSITGAKLSMTEISHLNKTLREEDGEQRVIGYVNSKTTGLNIETAQKIDLPPIEVEACIAALAAGNSPVTEEDTGGLVAVKAALRRNRRLPTRFQAFGTVCAILLTLATTGVYESLKDLANAALNQLSFEPPKTLTQVDSPVETESVITKGAGEFKPVPFPPQTPIESNEEPQSNAEAILPMQEPPVEVAGPQSIWPVITRPDTSDLNTDEAEMQIVPSTDTSSQIATEGTLNLSNSITSPFYVLNSAGSISPELMSRFQKLGIDQIGDFINDLKFENFRVGTVCIESGACQTTVTLPDDLQNTFLPTYFDYGVRSENFSGQTFPRGTVAVYTTFPSDSSARISETLYFGTNRENGVLLSLPLGSIKNNLQSTLLLNVDPAGRWYLIPKGSTAEGYAFPMQFPLTDVNGSYTGLDVASSDYFQQLQSSGENIPLLTIIRTTPDGLYSDTINISADIIVLPNLLQEILSAPMVVNINGSNVLYQGPMLAAMGVPAGSLFSVLPINSAQSSNDQQFPVPDFAILNIQGPPSGQ